MPQKPLRPELSKYFVCVCLTIVYQDCSNNPSKAKKDQPKVS